MFDALRNRFDDNMIDEALNMMKHHRFKMMILVRRVESMNF